MKNQHIIDVLAVHRENLLESKTFEEYRDAHVAYVDMLIQRAQADHLKEEAIRTWIAVTDKPPPAAE